MNFIQNVIGSLNYPNRLRTEGAFTGEFNWNSGLSIAQMQSAIGNAFQTSNQYSLLQQAASLLTSVEVLDYPNDPIAALIFISDTSDAALKNADRWFARLNNVQITFILVGPNYQLSFLKLIVNQVSNPERIRYGKYDANFFSISGWSPYTTKQTLQSDIDNTKQLNSQTSILEAIQMLTLDLYQNQTFPDASLIIITDTTNSTAIQLAVDLYNLKLKNNGIKLTFILAGSKTNANALQGFEDAIFFNWQNIGFFSQPDSWDLFQALRCPLELETTISPYFPCQSWIHFGVDDSNYLNNAQFENQLNFILSAIGALSYPERIQAVGMYNQPATWNSGLTIQQIQNAVTTQLSQAGPYSLRTQFGALISNLQNTQINNIPVGALIFISDTSNSALEGAINLLPQLTNDKITFVLLGSDADETKLTQFSSNFLVRLVTTTS
uniref:VWFA domain-containing protein n=1 Tax=Panagrolaimus sp. ES5 TaxID=591445 RepID=A0AC34GPL0_9BILA